MILFFSQVPAYRALNREQKKRVRSALKRKLYSWPRNRLPMWMFSVVFLLASIGPRDISDATRYGYLGVFLLCSLIYQMILAIHEAQFLSKFPERIEAYKDHPLGI